MFQNPIPVKVTIITVCYQSAHTLRDAIDSVLCQQGVDIEFVVVDGRSSDGTVELLKEYGSRITRWVSEPDGGIYDAMNKGVSMATGDLIGFLHADDLLAHSRIIADMLDIVEKNNADVIYGDLVYVQKDNPAQIVRYWKSKPFVLSLLRKGWMPPHPTVYIRKELFDKTGFFNVTYRISADYDFLLRLLSTPSIRVAYLPQIVVRMRVGGASNRSIGNIIRKSKEDYWALHRNQIGGIGALLNKNFSKIGQFFKRS